MGKAMKMYRPVERLEVSSDGVMFVKTKFGKIHPIKGEVMYQTPVDSTVRQVIAENGEKFGIMGLDEAVISARPSKVFFQTIADHTNAYLFESKEPPAEIATAIKNIVDDHINEREIVIRAGDYASVQNYIRNSKK